MHKAFAGRERSERLNEHRLIEPRVVFHEERFELLPVVATAEMYRVHAKEIASRPSVEQRIHLPCGVIWMQEGPDLKDNRFPSAPEDAEVHLAGRTVRLADHHLDKAGCASANGHRELVSTKRRYHIGLDFRRPATVCAEQIYVTEGRAAIPWSWTAWPPPRTNPRSPIASNAICASRAWDASIGCGEARGIRFPKAREPDAPGTGYASRGAEAVS